MVRSDEPTVINANNISSLSEKLIQLNKTSVLTTGITTGYEVSDNQLREFVITNAVVKKLSEKKHSAELLLINDTLDPFTEMYYNRLIKFDPTLTSYSQYIGHPIARIPSPYGINQSLAMYFQTLLVNKLKAQGIYPKIISTHESYQTEYYQKKTTYLSSTKRKSRQHLKRLQAKPTKRYTDLFALHAVELIRPSSPTQKKSTPAPHATSKSHFKEYLTGNSYGV